MTVLNHVEIPLFVAIGVSLIATIVVVQKYRCQVTNLRERLSKEKHAGRIAHLSKMASDAKVKELEIACRELEKELEALKKAKQ